MAEVKLKNGYIKISNSLFENLYFRKFTKRELLIISLIIRMSYGYNSKTAIIKPKNWFGACGIYQPDINNVLKGLINKNVIKDLGNGEYSINKNYDEWTVYYPKIFDIYRFTLLKTLQQKIVKHSKNDEQNTINNNSETLSNNIVNNYTQKPENISDDGNTDAPKNNKDNKDNINIHTLLIAGKEVAENVCVILKNYAKKMGAKNIDAYIASLVKNDAHMKIFEEETKKKEQAEVIKKANTYIPPWKKPDFVPATPEEVEEINKRFKEKMRNRGKNENS